MFRLKLIWVWLGFLDFHICTFWATIILDFFIFLKSLLGLCDNLRIAFRYAHTYLSERLIFIFMSLMRILFASQVIIFGFQLLIVFLHLQVIRLGFRVWSVFFVLHF